MENIKASISFKESLESNLAVIKQEIISMMQINPTHQGNIEDVKLLVENMFAKDLLSREDIYALTDTADLVGNWISERDKIEEKLTKSSCFLRDKKEKRLVELNNNLDIISGKILEWVFIKIKNQDLRLFNCSEEEWKGKKVSELREKLEDLNSKIEAEWLRNEMSKVLGEEVEDETPSLKETANRIAFDLFLLEKITQEILINDFLRSTEGVAVRYDKLVKSLEGK